MLDSYHSINLSLLIIGAYALTWLLVKLKKIELITHRKLWNIILLGSFLVSGILGLILAVSIDQKNIYTWYRTALWTHVELGTVMAIISIFHAVWHVKYYLAIIKK